MDPDLDLDMDMETLADDANAALADDSGGEAERNEAAEAEAEVERYEAAEAEADILRDRFRLAVISIATAEGIIASSRASIRSWELKSPQKSSPFLACGICAGKKAGMTVADPVVSCIADLAFKSAGPSPRTLPFCNQ